MSKEFNSFLNRVQDKLAKEHYRKKKFRAFENFPLLKGQCFYILNFKNRTVAYQRGVYEMLGYTPEEFTFEFVLDGFFHPDDRDMLKRLIEAATTFATDNNVKKGMAFCLTYRVIKRDGTYLNVLRQSSAYETDRKGRLMSNFTVLSDIAFISKGDNIDWRFEAPGFDKEKFRKYVALSYQGFFSEREIDILKLMKHGHTSEQIGKKLFLSKHTVDTHRRNMLKKSNCRNTIDLLNFCDRNKLI